jgi:hypothetical protein
MHRLNASFRDPSGYIFLNEDVVYRRVNASYAPQYDQLLSSGLYDALVKKGWLVTHEEVEAPSLPGHEDAYRLLRPEPIPYISFPYEWCFSQLKDAALLTLKIAAQALQRGMVLKDASAFNVQFMGHRPVFIDTLSFETYQEGAPWVAYRQFCQHFLAPLALMANGHASLSQLLVTHIDGIPLETTASLLPMRTRLQSGLYTHIHLHAKTQQRFADAADDKQPITSAKAPRISKKAFRAILESLATTVQKLVWQPPKTEWGSYYDATNYSAGAADNKASLIGELLAGIDGPITVCHDLGANRGLYSEVAAQHCAQVISQDIDPVAVESQYRERKTRGPDNILPLLQDLTAPSPAIGWRNRERDGFIQRAQCDVVLALALVHHLAISNNTPLSEIAGFFSDLAPHLIIEFVPKADSQVKRLLATREDIFPDYTEAGFEAAFSPFFEISQKAKVSDSERTLYLMTRK